MNSSSHNKGCGMLNIPECCKHVGQGIPAMLHEEEVPRLCHLVEWGGTLGKWPNVHCVFRRGLPCNSCGRHWSKMLQVRRHCYSCCKHLQEEQTGQHALQSRCPRGGGGTNIPKHPSQAFPACFLGLATPSLTSWKDARVAAERRQGCMVHGLSLLPVMAGQTAKPTPRIN